MSGNVTTPEQFHSLNCTGRSMIAYRSAKSVESRAVDKDHGPTFTPGDVVALAIIGELVKDYGVRVELMDDRFDRLFTGCRGQSWVSLKTCIALFVYHESRRRIE